MGAKRKIAAVIFLLIIVGLAVWELTSPQQLSVTGMKYPQSTQYSSRGSWIVYQSSSSGSSYLAFSIANLTFPRPVLSTTYSLVISKVNETVKGFWMRSFTLRVTGLTVEDNYDGAVGKFGKGNNLTDAVQVTALFFFRTSANHELRFTVNYELYDLLAFGYTVDHTDTRSFNITQNIV